MLRGEKGGGFVGGCKRGRGGVDGWVGGGGDGWGSDEEGVVWGKGGWKGAEGRAAGGSLTGTTAGGAPGLFLDDEALQPGKGAAGLAAEGELEVEDVVRAQQGRAELHGLRVDGEEREDQHRRDVAVQQPGGFVGGAGGGVRGAESGVREWSGVGRVEVGREGGCGGLGEEGGNGG